MSRLVTAGVVVSVLVVVVVVFFAWARKTTRGLKPILAAATLEDFVAGRGGDYDFDYFLSVRHVDPEVESARQRCLAIRVEFPAIDGKGYCSPAGMREIVQLAKELRVAAVRNERRWK